MTGLGFRAFLVVQGLGGGHWSGEVGGITSSLNARLGQCALWFLLRGPGCNVSWKVNSTKVEICLFFTEVLFQRA